VIVLVLLGLLAGAATALSPCALPVLPVVFAAGSTGGRRRPLGIALGLAISFTFAVVVLVYVLSALGLPDSFARNLAIAVLVLFGIALAWPAAAQRVEAVLSRLMAGLSSRILGRLGSRMSPDAEDGFGSGLLVGMGLGFVYAPCAGPILAGVITATASQTFTIERLLVAAAYGIGSALTFLVLMLGGRKLIGPLAQRSGKVQSAMGVVMVLVGVAMFANFDTRFQTAIADALPSSVVNPTGALEKKVDVRKDLGTRAAAGTPSGLSDEGPAPEFVGNQEWFNTPGNEPLTLKEQRGEVVLVDFWTYTCINCIRTLPHIQQIWERYKDDGLVVVGVHTPEFPFERSADNVRDAIKQNGLTYPVAQDNEYETWNAYSNEYWPAQYLIDANGHQRYLHIGEGGEEEIEATIEALLAEAGRSTDAAKPAMREAAESAPDYQTTPETYLGSDRAERFANGTIRPGSQAFRAPDGGLNSDQLAYTGRWTISGEKATSDSADARIALHFNARHVFLVLSPSSSGGDQVGVKLDGAPIPSEMAGTDVTAARLTVDSQRLYRIVDLRKPGSGVLELTLPKGVSGYAFTFG
jgi:cytochrome c biogenesis protein CcdA/thiol-disulfide isomerase/thioredoxin